MVASSPVRHEPPQSMQPTPVEVQSYQPPWKALSDFAAMQGDLDQPPFQQLVSTCHVTSTNTPNIYANCSWLYLISIGLHGVSRRKNKMSVGKRSNHIHVHAAGDLVLSMSDM